jgi:hypothetical protein
MLIARRLFLLGALLAALAMLMAPLAGADDDDDDGGGGGDAAFCAPAGPPMPGQCSATPIPQLPFVVPFDFDASSGPLGENPMGTWVQGGSFFLFFPFEAQITCLQVTGNHAAFGGVITATSPPGVAGQGVAATVLDNTPLGPDLMSQLTVSTAPPAPNTPNCGSVLPTTLVVTGDIVVQDNTAGGGGDDDDDDDEDDDDGDDDDDDDDDGDDD